MLSERTTKVSTGVTRKDRVRKGKVQRRKLDTTKKGYKVQDDKVVKMNPSEKRRRKVSAKKAARKRKAKLSSILKKRKVSISKGKRQGFYK